MLNIGAPAREIDIFSNMLHIATDWMLNTLMTHKSPPRGPQEAAKKLPRCTKKPQEPSKSFP